MKGIWGSLAVLALAIGGSTAGSASAVEIRTGTSATITTGGYAYSNGSYVTNTSESYNGQFFNVQLSGADSKLPGNNGNDKPVGNANKGNVLDFSFEYGPLSLSAKGDSLAGSFVFGAFDKSVQTTESGYFGSSNSFGGAASSAFISF